MLQFNQPLTYMLLQLCVLLAIFGEICTFNNNNNNYIDEDATTLQIFVSNSRISCYEQGACGYNITCTCHSIKEALSSISTLLQINSFTTQSTNNNNIKNKIIQKEEAINYSQVTINISEGTYYCKKKDVNNSSSNENCQLYPSQYTSLPLSIMYVNNLMILVFYNINYLLNLYINNIAFSNVNIEETKAVKYA